ncbi:MAG: CubicO group peptidase (beta-lactamase class C family) [Candidatus Azotimanducaceae bacterium]|jgi:CubicO group peptidase (beta-lactamase class C family)
MLEREEKVQENTMQKLITVMLGLLFSTITHGQTLVPLPEHPSGLPWPTATWSNSELANDVDKAALDSAIANLFAVKQDNGVPDTRAVLIIKSGQIVHEQYAEGFSKDSRFHSWSAAKSFTNALIGVLANQGKLDLDQQAPIPAWQDDERSQITVRHMLNMTSGMDNSDSADGGFLGEALYGRGALDVNQIAANRPLISEPNSEWAYSTATSNLLAFVAGNIMGDDRDSRQAYVNQHLLSPIGADDIIMSYDKAGYFLGGSQVYATARDYARLGYLYLRDGVWDGQRILPEGWVDFSRTRAPAANNGNHAAHFWLNVKGKGWQPGMLPGGPESAFVIAGNGGQYVYILPSHDMLLVRLGEWQVFSRTDLVKSLAAVVAAFPPQKETTESEIETENESAE